MTKAARPKIAPGPATGFGVSMPADRLVYQAPEAQDRELADVAAVGATWIRLDLWWFVVEPTRKGTRRWARFDTTIRKARRHGLKVLLIPQGTPPWANGGAPFTVPPTKTADYAAFLRRAVRRYKRAVDAWEIWNEPNQKDFWTGTQAQYAQLLIAAYKAIKKVDRSTTVLSAGLAPASETADSSGVISWVESLYRYGAKGSFDALALHFYPPSAESGLDGDPATPWSNRGPFRPNVRSIMEAHRDGKKRIWATEWGYSTSGQSEATIQASIQKDVTTWTQHERVGVLFWYTDRDDSGYGLSLDSYPLIHRPRWDSYRQAICQSRWAARRCLTAP